MKYRTFLAGAFVAIAAALPIAQSKLDTNINDKIRQEETQHSQIMRTMHFLADVYGPRLTGSPTLHQAGEWARDRLTQWGMTNAALEPSGNTSRGWSLERFSIEMTEPQYMRITGYPRAWSPALPAPLTGTPVVVEVKSKEDFDKYHGNLRGAIVMNGRPDQADIGFQPEAKRLTDEELKKQEGQVDPAASGFGNTPKSYWDEEDEFQKALGKQREVYDYFAKEGAAICSDAR